jgi:hypothetical protein
MAALFEFHGPADVLEPVRQALGWVVDPSTSASLLAGGALRRVHAAEGKLVVYLRLPPSATRQVVVEDAQAELFDHLQGQWEIEIRVGEPPPAEVLRAAAG